MVTGGLYAVNTATKGTLPLEGGYALLFVKKIYDWIYQDIYYTSEDRLNHYQRKRINDGSWSNWFQYITNSDIDIQNNTDKVLISITKDNVEVNEPSNTFYIIRNDYCFVSLSAVKMLSKAGGEALRNMPTPVGRVNFCLHQAGLDSKPIIWGCIEPFNGIMYFNDIEESLIGLSGWCSFCYPIAK